MVLLQVRRTFTTFIGRGTCNDIPHLYDKISFTIATKLYWKHITRLSPLAFYTGYMLMCFLAVTSPPCTPIGMEQQKPTTTETVDTNGSQEYSQYYKVNITSVC